MKYIVIPCVFILFLFACAGGSNRPTSSAVHPGAGGDLLPIAGQGIYATVNPTLNMILLKSRVTIDKSSLGKRDYGYFLLNKAFYVSDISLNGKNVAVVPVRGIKPGMFGEGLTDSQWDRIREYGSLYRVDLASVRNAADIVMEINGNLRVTADMTCCQLDDDEFVLDGESFWYPSTLQNDYPVHLEVLHPANFYVELLDNQGAFEEVTPTMHRSVFDVSGMQEPLLLSGERN